MRRSDFNGVVIERAGPQTQRARSALSTRRLLEAAAELIAEVGYERTTLASIGERAGYSYGLVTRRFGSKEGLLWALIERMTVSWSEQRLQPALRGLVGVDALVVIVDAIRESMRRSPQDMRALYALMFEALKPIPVLHAPISELHRALRTDVKRRVRKGQKAGVVPADADPVAVANLFVSALRGAAYQWMLEPDQFDFDRALLAIRTYAEQTLRVEESTR